MTRPTFQALLEDLGPMIKSCSIPLETKLLSTVWLLGTPECFRSVADRFDISKGTLHFIFLRICEAHTSLLPKYVSWPDVNSKKRIATTTKEKYNFPGAIGFIDGCYIPIKGQSHHRESFVNRKGTSSIILQAVCDDRLVFTDIFVGFAGSVHDARVLRNSPLFAGLEDGSITTCGGHLLGDSAYPLHTYLLNPYRDNGHLAADEIRYNVLHSAARASIERAFALLKGKFRRLKYLDMCFLQKMPQVVSSCAVLHNVILLYECLEENASIIEDIPEFGPYTNGVEKRMAVKRSL